MIDKIKAEKRRNRWKEFGGYLIVEKGVVQDIVFDIEMATSGYVRFGCQQIVKLPAEQQPKVRGWFHAHPMVGLSQLDKHTMLDLTTFWGECYTLVLQSNNIIKGIKTICGTDIVFETPVVVKIEEEDIDLYPYLSRLKTNVLEFEPALEPYNKDSELEKDIEIEAQEVALVKFEEVKEEEQKKLCPYCYKHIKKVADYCTFCGRKQKSDSWRQRILEWIEPKYESYDNQKNNKKPPSNQGGRFA